MTGKIIPEKLMEFVVITGVSSGIGHNTARYLLERDYHVFGSVRSTSDADRVAQEMGKNFTPLVFDVRDIDAIREAAGIVRQKLDGKLLSGLINNAGVVIAGPLIHVSPEDLKYQMDVNVFGVMNVIREFLPLLGADMENTEPPGRIINISSVSGRITFPFIGPYAISKHALESMSTALRRELMLYGIDVIIVEPGNTDTPIWQKASQLPEYGDSDYAPVLAHLKKSLLSGSVHDALPVEKVSRVIYTALTASQPKTHYLILKKKIMGWLLPRLLPVRFLDRIIAQRLRLLP